MIGYTLEQIDNAVYNAIRLQAVALGYLPDETLFTDAKSYEDAKDAIRIAKGFCIEVYPVNSKQQNQNNLDSTIIVQRDNITVGDIGGNYKEIVPNEDGSFDVLQYPNSTYSISYNAYLYTQVMNREYAMNSIIENGWLDRSILKGLNNDLTETEKGFTVKRNGVMDTSGVDYIERYYRLSVNSVYLTEPKYLYTAPAMQTLTIEQQITQ